MRNFEERKEEIFRRSQARIAQRKKTVRRVVLACVPVVLCVGLASGYLALGSFGRSDSAVNESMMESPNYGMMADSEIELNGNEICDCPPEAPEMAPEIAESEVRLEIGNRVYTDWTVVDTFLAMVDVQQVTPETTGTDGKTNNTGGVTGENIIQDDPYPVCLHYPDGSEVWFILRGNHLTWVDGNTQLQLTDDQVQWLYGLMEE